MVESRQTELDAVLGEILPPAEKAGLSNSDRVGIDEGVLSRARKASNTKFEHLWQGDDSGYDSPSEADLALCSLLAFYTQDHGQIDRLFRRSGLYRDKWERQDYRDATIAKALEQKTATNGNHGVPRDGWRFEWKTLAEVAAEVPDRPDWIVPGFIAPATETLLFGPPKVGKSTLLCRCLAAAESGGTVFGMKVRQVSYALLSEENAWTLQEKMFDFGLRGHGGEALLHQRCQGVDWLEIIQETVERCKDKGHELLVIDTFTRWAGLGGENENHAGAVQAAWQPLAAAKEAGIATVVLHHARKMGGSHGSGIRGSSAFAALPDVLLELSRTGGEDETARVLNANSRFRDTPPALGLVYTGSDYEVTTDVASVRGGTRGKLLAALEDSPATQAVLAELVGVTKHTVAQHLRVLEGDGSVYHTGAGAGDDPYVYRLAERDS